VNTSTLFARQHFDLLLIEDSLLDQWIIRLKLPSRITVFGESSLLQSSAGPIVTHRVEHVFEVSRFHRGSMAPGFPRFAQLGLPLIHSQKENSRPSATCTVVMFFDLN
jgi:hypothetical protein